MGRTNVVVDDELVAQVMKLYGLKTKREAIHFALEMAANRDDRHRAALKLRGIGWDGDLEAMRRTRKFE
jgi:Arc/MetJ family transcription regulator